MRKAIDVLNLEVNYNSTPILKGISITINEGEFVSILGPNGAGKTTLIKAVMGIVNNVKGSVTLFNRPVKSYKKKELASYVSFLPQNPPVSLPFLVKDIVMMGRFPYLRRFETEGYNDIKAAESSMGLLGIEHLSKRHLMELSGGEIKRVFIAQALAQESTILFLDEPTANLDINYQIEIFRILKKFNEEMNKTIILITHDINHAARFAKRIVLLKDGKIFKTGSSNEIINNDDLNDVFNTNICVEYDRSNKPYILI